MRDKERVREREREREVERESERVREGIKRTNRKSQLKSLPIRRKTSYNLPSVYASPCYTSKSNNFEQIKSSLSFEH